MPSDPDEAPAPRGACPRCRVELAMQDLFTGGRHATIAGCLKCSGQWMKESDLQRLSEVVEPVIVEWRNLGSDQLALLRCPECKDAPVMRKLQNQRDTRVVLDACAQCRGVWLDANELRAIQQESLFALLAGLARSVVE